ncbi:ABC transporter ATP-binding protein [Methylomarinum vadi]|uniref:ABC transporter ATP-binding protein n=1 Tax=Methylomarinum vadi TaxID=438855 RepID=UPI0004DF6D8A|nr:ABC transporter ATP-binding protein [Methylomarinum vadi]
MSDKETLVKVDNISKKFCRDFKRSLWYGTLDISKAMLGIQPKQKLRKAEFWAVKDISFTLKRGECIGLIGHNGAGKSTLLKMLNGLIPPDGGRIEMRGRVNALIELGAGFNPILTGRENIYNNGAVLGLSKKEIDAKLDSIIEFSEIGDFIDSPVQNYSSGMRVRLGFAVAAQMEPDVLIIDEVLAVGDIGFVLKCFNRIDTILQNAAVIFVSHSMPQVSRICTEAILMDKGQAIYQGSNVSEGIDLYYSLFKTQHSTHFRGKGVSLNKILLNNTEITSENPSIQVKRLSDLTIKLDLNIDKRIKHPEISLGFFDKEMRTVANFIREEPIKKLANKNGKVFVCINLPRIQFSKGIYSIALSVSERRGGEILFRQQSFAHFQVIADHHVWSPFQLVGSINQLN